MGHYMNIFHIHTVAERAGYNIKLARKEFGQLRSEVGQE